VTARRWRLVTLAYEGDPSMAEVEHSRRRALEHSCGQVRWHHAPLTATLDRDGPSLDLGAVAAGVRRVTLESHRPAEAVRGSTAPARRFEAIICDWDGAAVADGCAPASRLRSLVEQACALGLELVLVSGRQLAEVDGRLRARPTGPGGLVLALDRGWEVFVVDDEGPRCALRRTATAEEVTALSRAAQLAGARLAARGLRVRTTWERRDRGRVDFFLQDEWKAAPGAPAAETVARDRVAATGAAGLCEVATAVRAAAAESGLPDARATPHADHVELALTDTSDVVAWVMRWMWQHGVWPDQVLVVGHESSELSGLAESDAGLRIADVRRRSSLSAGTEPSGDPTVWLGGGTEMFATVLEDQIARRQNSELPMLTEDVRWTRAVPGVDPVLERVRESVLTLADGRLGTRGSVIARPAGGEPGVVMSGVYTRTGAETHLLSAPRWNGLSLEEEPSGPVRRILDLRTALMRQQFGPDNDQLDAVIFSSLSRPGTAAMRALSRRHRLLPVRALQPPPPEITYQTGEDEGLVWGLVRGRPGSIGAAAHSCLSGSDRVLDRVVAYDGVTRGAADIRAARERASVARELGFDRLLCEHRRAWASRWEEADVRIEGDPALQFAVRFALFHLMASVADEGESAVGARGLSGRAYRGHVFWDSDVYVLPFLAATHPRAARAMLEYRIRRLPAALNNAEDQKRGGARFPWESAWSGHDVTPDHVRGRHGATASVMTGRLEEHIVADVAWAASCYIDWTGDRGFASGPGRELLVQTARWWASRIELDEDGSGHIRGVIGPDEYHEAIDDNAFTNVMARWNLSRAATLGAGEVDQGEQRRWLDLADRLVDGYDPTTGIYEQFAGFHRLEPLLISEIAPQRPVAADILLGHDRVRSAQVVKQADVLMLHYLIPDRVAAGSLEANLDFYEPRTAHGSTLSPGVHAALLARASRLQQALETLRLTTRIDLDDIGHMTAGGLHLAAMGSVWRALAQGFAGLRPIGDALAIDPVLAPGWDELELRVRLRGSRVRVRIRPGVVEATADPPLHALTPTGERVVLTESARVFEICTSQDRSVP
jgi:trehalose/maltose hydrolase-like predicted phosphorylase